LALCEAAALLSVAQFLTRCVPYSRWATLLGPIAREPGRAAFARERQVAGDVVRAVDIAARHLPWNVVCLPRAMAAKWMLARRNIPSVLHIGIGRTPDAAASASSSGLHAWLSAGPEILVGGEVADQFSVLARYGHDARRQPTDGTSLRAAERAKARD
jgi:hypothetical protein